MYKIKLTKKQIDTIYSISDKESTQTTLMSILSYLIKYTDETTNTLTKSFSKLYKMYLRYHNKITRSYFYTLIRKLKENNLLSFAAVEDEKEDKKEDKEKVSESVENTDLEGNSEKPNNLINKPILYTYTSNTTSVVKVAAIDLVEDLFKSLKVKSKEIKNMVRSKIQNIQLDQAGAIAYLMKVITEKTEQYNIMRNNYAAKVAESKRTYNYFNSPKKLRFDNFDHREIYDDDAAMESLEKRLLGWDK